jgi:hypothetical protein
VAHGVMPTVDADVQAGEPGAYPRAHVLARLQAAAPGWAVSGARHVMLELDEPARMLLGMLDGSRTIDALVDIMQARAWEAWPREVIRDRTLQQLWLFARQGLLVK